VLGRSGVAILLTALDGEGRRDDSSKAREGASTARDDGYTMVRDSVLQNKVLWYLHTVLTY
jgi:hypothetical protein